MRNLFYCSKCKKLELDFQFDDIKQRDQITWQNPRDGYGRHITHIICPDCGYELSGFMFVLGLFESENDINGIEYVKSVIEIYSNNLFIDTEKLLNTIRSKINKDKG